MTLHEAIINILSETDRPLTAREISDVINERGLYIRKDKNPTTSVHVSARVKNYPDLFQITDEGITLGDRNLVALRRILNELNQFLRSRTRITYAESRVLINSMIFVVLAKDRNIDYYSKTEKRDKSNQQKSTVVFKLKISEYKKYIIQLFEKVEGQFGQSNVLLKPAINALEKLSVSDCDELLHKLYLIQEFIQLDSDSYGKFFNDLVNEFSYNDFKNHYEYSTPQPVANLMAKLFELPSGSMVFDPFAGFCSTLVAICSENSSKKLWAIPGDISDISVSLGSQNLIVNGVQHSQYIKKDAFLDWPESLNADCVVINPPLNSRLKLGFTEFFTSLSIQRELLNHDAGTFDPLLASIVLSVFHLNSKGKAAVIVPNSFLFSEKREYRNFREALLKRNLISGIISLPLNSYRPFTNVGFSLLLIDKCKREEDVYFFDGAEVRLEKFDSEVPRIADAFREKRNIEDVSRLVSNYDINQRSFDLSPKSYVIDKIEGPDLFALDDLLLECYGGITIKKHNLNEKEGIPYIQIGDLSDDISSPNLDLKKVKQYVSDSELLGSPRFIPQNSILIAKVGMKLKPTFFGSDVKAICNANILILKPNTSEITTDYLITQLQSEYVLTQIDAIRRYIGVPNFSKADFLQVKVRKPAIVDQLKQTFEFYAQQLSSEKVINEKRTEDELYNLISGLKHEIKQPISSIGLDVDSLKDFLDKKISQNEKLSWGETVVELLPGQTKEDLAGSDLQSVFTRMVTCLSEAQHTLSKAEETLNLSKGVFAPESFKLKNLLNEIVAIYQSSNCSINISGQDVELYADKYQISVMFRRLIENAIKHGFGNKGDRNENIVNIKLLGKEASGSFNEIVVENNGRPLPPSFSISVFQEKGLTSDRNTGSGFGGYHIKRVIENHKGEIHLASPAEIGESLFKVRFKIYLP